MLYLLFLGLARKYRLEEEHPEYQKQNDDFQENQNPQGATPCHVPEAIGIEVPNGE